MLIYSIGLGKTSEKLANDDDLSCGDFVDEIDDLEDLNYVESELQNEFPDKSFASVPEENITKSQDNLNGVLSENKQASNQASQGFKTPVLGKHKSSSSEVSTPCLFSPDLLSQATQGNIYNSVVKLLEVRLELLLLS